MYNTFGSTMDAQIKESSGESYSCNKSHDHRRVFKIQQQLQNADMLSSICLIRRLITCQLSFTSRVHTGVSKGSLQLGPVGTENVLSYN